MTLADKYRVQTRFANPPEIAAHTGKTHKWVDVAAFHTLSEAKKACALEQRVIKLCTKSEGALLIDRAGRRFNVCVSPAKQEVAA